MEINESNIDRVLVMVMTDPSVSYWLKGALKELMKRDPVDALKDAELLVRLLRANFEKMKGAY